MIIKYSLYIERNKYFKFDDKIITDILDLCQKDKDININKGDKQFKIYINNHMYLIMKVYKYIYMDIYKITDNNDYTHLQQYEISKENWIRLNDIYNMRISIKKYNI